MILTLFMDVFVRICVYEDTKNNMQARVNYKKEFLCRNLKVV